MGVNFLLKACGWVIILIYKSSGLVISIILPGNGWFSCKVDKTYCNLANFGSCFIVHSLGIGMGQFFNSVATHLSTNDFEVAPGI